MSDERFENTQPFLRDKVQRQAVVLDLVMQSWLYDKDYTERHTVTIPVDGTVTMRDTEEDREYYTKVLNVLNRKYNCRMRLIALDVQDDPEIAFAGMTVSCTLGDLWKLMIGIYPVTANFVQDLGAYLSHINVYEQHRTCDTVAIWKPENLLYLLRAVLHVLFRDKRIEVEGRTTIFK